LNSATLAVGTLMCLAATVPQTALAQDSRSVPFRVERGIDAFAGVHAGVPEAFTIAAAVGLGSIAPGFGFVALEPGYGAGRRSIGWLLRDRGEPLSAFGEHGFGFALRVSQLTTYQHAALYRPGRTYYGPEVHMILPAFGVRLGMFAGAGRGAARAIIALGLGAGV